MAPSSLRLERPPPVTGRELTTRGDLVPEQLATVLVGLLSLAFGVVLYRARRALARGMARQQYQIAQSLPENFRVAAFFNPGLWQAAVTAAALALVLFGVYSLGVSLLLATFVKQAEPLPPPSLPARSVEWMRYAPYLLASGAASLIFGLYVLSNQAWVGRILQFLLDPDLPVDTPYPEKSDREPAPISTGWAMTARGIGIALVAISIVLAAIGLLLFLSRSG